MSQAKTISIPVTAGMRQDLSPHMAPPGTLTDALNVRFPIVGEVESRRGTTALSVATSADVAYADVMSSTGPDFLQRVPGGFVFGAQGFGYRYDFGQERLHVSGSYSNAEPLGVFDVIAREEADAATGFPWPLSQAAKNGYVCTVHSSGNGQAAIGPGDGRIIVHVFTESGTLVTSAAYTGVSAAWVVEDGGSSTDMVLVLQDATTGITARVITTDATGATIGGATSYATLDTATSYWAACTWPGAGWALVSQSNATTIGVRRIVGGITTHTASITVGGAELPVSAYADTTNLYVGWSEGSDALARVYDATLTLTSGVGAVTIVSPGNQGPPLFGPSLTAAAANYVITVSPNAAIEDSSYIYFGTLTAAGSSTLNHQAFQCTALSAPFGYGYVWVRAAGYDNVNASGFVRPLLLDFMAERTTTASNIGNWDGVVALTGQLFLRTGTSQGFWYKQHLSAPAALSDGTLVMGIPRFVRVDAASPAFALCEWVRFSLGRKRRGCLFRNTAIVAGLPAFAQPTLGTRNYDGSASLGPQTAGVDVGFPMPPALSVTVSNGPGSLMPSSTYQWRIVIERIDSDGNRFRSAPSAVTMRQLGASDDTGTVTGRMNMSWMRANAMFWHSSRFVMHVYRTEANGSTFYRSTPGMDAPTASTAGVFTFTDRVADSLLRTGEILYTDGGVLDNNCPPSCRFISVSEDRVWLAGLWETEQLQSSKILVPEEPPQFSDSPAFKVVLPDDCTGLAAQDGVLLAFCKSAIYAVQGGGPTDQGQGAWDSPRVITRSTGAIRDSIMLETSIGIFFQSGRGIELLPRGLGEPQFVGAPVQTTLGTTTITSAAVITSGTNRTARFCLGSTTVLVYDLNTGAWSRDVYPAAVTHITDTDNGAVLALKDISSDYGFLLEGATTTQDSVGNSPAAISSTLEWAAVRPFGIAGQGRFTAALGMFDALSSGGASGYQSGDATLFVTVDRQTDPGKAFNMATFNQPDYRKHAPLHDVGTACKLKVTTAASGWRFMGWTLELDDMGGGRRVAETEQG